MNLAMWFPSISVGVFSMILAVVGAIVAIMEFKGKKRIILAATFIILGLCEIVVITKADAAHEIEVKAQHDDIESFKTQLRDSETKRQVDNAILRTTLQDYGKLSQLGPALMKLAQTSAEYQKKQYETKVMNDKEIYTLTMATAKRIRDFSSKYSTLERQQIYDMMNNVRHASSEAEKQQRWSEDSNKTTQLYYARQAEFQNSILPDAIYARSELLKRKMPEPALEPSQMSEVNMVLHGALAGINPELTLATYLELMAKPLSRK